jgi:hypothetical protein
VSYHTKFGRTTKIEICVVRQKIFGRTTKKFRLDDTKFPSTLAKVFVGFKGRPIFSCQLSWSKEAIYLLQKNYYQSSRQPGCIDIKA